MGVCLFLQEGGVAGPIIAIPQERLHPNPQLLSTLPRIAEWAWRVCFGEGSQEDGRVPWGSQVAQRNQKRP